MNDAVRGQVEALCKSQLWHVSKFICNKVQINFACEIVMTNIDDYRPMIVNSDEKMADKSLKMSAVVDFCKIYGHFIVTTMNGHRSTTQSQVKTAMKDWFIAMDPGKYPTPAQCQKMVLRIGLQENKEDPTVNAKERSWLLWHADVAVPKCAGVDYWTKPQRQESLMSWTGPVDRHVETHVTPSTESIVCIYYKNLFSKVAYEVECKRLNPNAKPPHDTKNSRWCTKWSDAKIGQSTFGGWKPQALTKFLVLS
jgi:hypothetical protein